jgi:hydrogenase maturation protein HypF
MRSEATRAEQATVDDHALRLRLSVRGAVQGVGFRPFIYRLATELGLAGWVQNSAQGVFIEVEGSQRRLNEFLLRIEGSSLRAPSFKASNRCGWMRPDTPDSGCA